MPLGPKPPRRMKRRARPAPGLRGDSSAAMRAGAAVALIALSSAALTGRVTTGAFVAQPIARGAQLRQAARPATVAAPAEAAGAPAVPARSDAAMLKFAACGLLLCFPWRPLASPRKRSPAACRVAVECRQAAQAGFSVPQPSPFPQAVSAAPPHAAPIAAEPVNAAKPSARPSCVPQTFWIGEPSVVPSAVLPLAAPAAPAFSRAPSSTRRRHAPARFVAGARHCSVPRTRPQRAARAAAAAERACRRATGAKLEGSSGAIVMPEPQIATYDSSRVRGVIQRGLLDIANSQAEHGGREPKAPWAGVGRNVFAGMCRAFSSGQKYNQPPLRTQMVSTGSAKSLATDDGSSLEQAIFAAWLRPGPKKRERAGAAVLLVQGPCYGRGPFRVKQLGGAGSSGARLTVAVVAARAWSSPDEWPSRKGAVIEA